MKKSSESQPWQNIPEYLSALVSILRLKMVAWFEKTSLICISRIFEFCEYKYNFEVDLRKL